MAQAIEMEMPDTQSTLRWVCMHHVGRPRSIDGMTKRIICALNHAFELKDSARMNDIMHLSKVQKRASECRRRQLILE